MIITDDRLGNRLASCERTRMSANRNYFWNIATKLVSQMNVRRLDESGKRKRKRKQKETKSSESVVVVLLLIHAH